MFQFHVSRLAPALSLTLAVLLLCVSATAQETDEAAVRASLGGPESATAQQETDRLRRLEYPRWPGLDRAIDPAATAKTSRRVQNFATMP
ncbi:hypothetical protein [Ruegeria arenilitoris]|uniref:hypothetical protein n=1 Tax=Ruegeria arenilitoris TaxID=1173585 RepID=UPI00147AF311|nr:hypothetical protein [Ruegeria arenilitoris]